MRKLREIARICLIKENTGLDPLCCPSRPHHRWWRTHNSRAALAPLPGPTPSALAAAGCRYRGCQRFAAPPHMAALNGRA